MIPSGDTWGISGPTFLLAYLVLAVAVTVTASVARRSLADVSAERPATRLDRAPVRRGVPERGRQLAVTAALSAMYRAGTITTSARGFVVAGQRPDSRTDELERAIHHVAAGPAAARHRLRDGRDGRLGAAPYRAASWSAAGLLLTAQRRQRIRLAGGWVLAVAVFGVVRVMAGFANNRPVGFLTIRVVLVTAAGVLLVATAPRRTRAGDALLRRLAADHHALSPSAGPDWAVHGPAGAALAVGVFGVGALWAADPAFATELAAQRVATSGSGGFLSGGDSGGAAAVAVAAAAAVGAAAVADRARVVGQPGGHAPPVVPADERPPRGGTTGGSPRGGHHGRRHGGPLRGRGIGIGWRPAIAGAVDDLPGLRFCEVIAESLGVGPRPRRSARGVAELRGRGRGGRSRDGVRLSLGVRSRSTPCGSPTSPPAPRRSMRPLVSEHVAFVRAGGRGSRAPAAAAPQPRRAGRPDRARTPAPGRAGRPARAGTDRGAVRLAGRRVRRGRVPHRPARAHRRDAAARRRQRVRERAEPRHGPGGAVRRDPAGAGGVRARRRWCRARRGPRRLPRHAHRPRPAGGAHTAGTAARAARRRTRGDARTRRPLPARRRAARRARRDRRRSRRSPRPPRHDPRVARSCPASCASEHGESRGCARRVARSCTGRGARRPRRRARRPAGRAGRALWSRTVPCRRGSTPASSPLPGVPCCAKRAGEAAAVWPLLAASLGPAWLAAFTDSVARRAPAGALREGWDLARELRRRGSWATPPPSSSPSARRPCVETGGGAGCRPAGGVRAVSLCRSGGGSTTSASADRIRRRCPSHIPAHPKCRCGLLDSR